MNDRQLLELAAKACGGQLVDTTEGYPYGGHFLPHPAGPWDPLTDDGDALRLAFTLRLHSRVTFSIGFKQVQAYRKSDAAVKSYDLFGIVGYGTGTAKEPTLENLRRAIVRAAAAIGATL